MLLDTGTVLAKKKTVEMGVGLGRAHTYVHMESVSGGRFKMRGGGEG